MIGALVGSRIADRFGPKPVVAGCFLIGALSIAVLTLSLPLGVLLLFVAIVGLGTSGTQTLIYGFVANYFTTKVRGAAVAWCAGFGRLGGVGGPLLGGFLVAAGLALNSIFYILAALALLGMVLTLLRADPPHTRRAPHTDRALGHGATPDQRPPGAETREHVRHPGAARALPTDDVKGRQRVQPDARDHRRLARLSRQLAQAHHPVREDVRRDGVSAARRARAHHPRATSARGPGSACTSVEDDADVRERAVVQQAVDEIAAAGVEVHGEMIEATEHDVADVVVQRAKELDVDLIVLGYQYYRGSLVAEHVVRQQPHCSILLARPPESHRESHRR